jgi:hypothetical protein
MSAIASGVTACANASAGTNWRAAAVFSSWIWQIPVAMSGPGIAFGVIRQKEPRQTG